LAANAGKYPAKRNPEFSPDWKLTKEEAAASLNNFYEFFPNRATDIRKLTGKFITSPWPVQITGLVEKPMTFDVEEIVSFEPDDGGSQRVHRLQTVGFRRGAAMRSARYQRRVEGSQMKMIAIVPRPREQAPSCVIAKRLGKRPRIRAPHDLVHATIGVSKMSFWTAFTGTTPAL
jgi:hypothetical protein